MLTFVDLAEKLKMDVTDLMKQCNGKTMPSKGLARELGINESYLDKLAEDVRRGGRGHDTYPRFHRSCNFPHGTI
jgi:hypothetical protein